MLNVSFLLLIGKGDVLPSDFSGMICLYPEEGREVMGFRPKGMMCGLVGRIKSAFEKKAKGSDFMESYF